MFSFKRLPDADALFRRYFDPWYSAEAREVKRYPETRPDLETVPELVGQSAHDVCMLMPESADVELEQVAAMLDAARGDWPKYLPVREPIDVAWIDAFDVFYDKSRVKALLARSSPDEFGNDYLVTACEFGAVLGEVLRQQVPRLEWVAGNPYWESALFDPKTGSLIAVFHWAIKKLSSYGLDDGFVDKIEACKQSLEGGP